MVKKLLVGNWKMNGDRDALVELDQISSTASFFRSVDVAICTPFTLIERAASRAPAITIGAQDCHVATVGAYTGSVSAGMLVEAGAKLVILGHSERRMAFYETDAQVKSKAETAIAAGMTAIICVGETEFERASGQALTRVSDQLDGSLPIGAGNAIVVAYEPVWAIGSGRIPTINEIAEMHAMIRARLHHLIGGEQAELVHILYGGSMAASNANELLQIENVDGGLIGGASLKASTFVPIIEAASVGPLNA